MTPRGDVQHTVAPVLFAVAMIMSMAGGGNAVIANINDWYFGELGQSCDQVCAVQGGGTGVCTTTALQSLDTQSDLQAVSTHTGAPCTSFYPGSGWQQQPSWYTFTSNACYGYGPDYKLSTNCYASDLQIRRFCPCVGSTPPGFSTQSPTTSSPIQSPTRSPTQSPTTSSPTQAPTRSPTQSPTTSLPTQAPTTSPTQSPTTSSPTQSPTSSPTVSPTASPTTRCSSLQQTFSITESATNCNPAPTSVVGKQSKKGEGMGCPGSNRTLLEAFMVIWAANDYFASAAVSLDDVVDSITAESEWNVADSVWVHTITIEYKPESPLSHIGIDVAARQLIGTLSGGLSYCGCNPSVAVLAVDYSYNMAEVPAASASSSSASSLSSSGKCKGGYRASRGKKVGKSSISSNLSANSGATSSAVIAAVVVAVVIVAAGLLVLQRRVSRRDVGQEWQHADAAAQHSHAQTVVMYEA